MYTCLSALALIPLGHFGCSHIYFSHINLTSSKFIITRPQIDWWQHRHQPVSVSLQTVEKLPTIKFLCISKTKPAEMGYWGVKLFQSDYAYDMIDEINQGVGI